MDHIGTEALLFQTGYLTITGAQQLGGKELYRLGYPNREVRQSLNEHLLRHLVQDVGRQVANGHGNQCRSEHRDVPMPDRGDGVELKDADHVGQELARPGGAKIVRSRYGAAHSSAPSIRPR